MNKKVEELRRKSNKIINTIKLLGICILLLAFLISIVQYKITKSKSKDDRQETNNGMIEYDLNIKDNDIVYDENLNIQLKIEGDIQDNNKIIVKNNSEVNYEKELEKENNFNIILKNEGKNEVNIIIYHGEEIISNEIFNIYYIKPYNKQFLDEYSKTGVGTHLRLDQYDIDKETTLIKNLGMNKIRMEMQWQGVGGVKAKNFKFSFYDQWIQAFEEKKISPLMIINAPNAYFGEDDRMSSDEDLNKWLYFANAVINQYPYINNFEVFNEPNVKYMDDEGMKWYANAVIRNKKITQ